MSGTPSPLASLVLCIIVIAFAATLFAAVHYFVIDLPQQQNELIAPANHECGRGDCWKDCHLEHKIRRDSCWDQCRAKYPDANWWVADAIALDICMDWCIDNIVESPACKEECDRAFIC